MTKAVLNAFLAAEIAAFPAQVSLLMTDLNNGETLHAHQPDRRVVSASIIKVPILVAALEKVRLGELSLTQTLSLTPEEVLPDTAVFDRGVLDHTLWELLYWMIVESDNTATNRIIRLVGYDWINEYAAALGLNDTTCHRKMLDFAAVAEGVNNFTSAADQGHLYQLLYANRILTPALVETAMDMLRRQRSMDMFLRYIPDPIVVAHKTGGLDFLDHDAGIFLLPNRRFYLGIFTWEGPSPERDPRQRRFVGRLARAIYDTYRDLI